MSAWSFGCLQKIWQGTVFWNFGLYFLLELGYRMKLTVMERGRFCFKSRYSFCLWYHQSDERKGSGCSFMHVWMLDILQEKQRSWPSLSQRLSNLHRGGSTPDRLNTFVSCCTGSVKEPPRGNMPSLLPSMGGHEAKFSGDHCWFLLMLQKGQSTLLSQLLQGEHEIFRMGKMDGNNLKGNSCSALLMIHIF